MDLRCSTHPPPPSSDEDEDEEDEDDALVMTLVVVVPRRLAFTQKLLFVCFLSSPIIIIIIRLLPEKKSLADFTKTREAPRLPRGGSAPPLFFLCDQCPAKEFFFFFFVFASDENVALGPLDKEALCDEHKCIIIVVIFRALLLKKEKKQGLLLLLLLLVRRRLFQKPLFAPENEDATPTRKSKCVCGGGGRTDVFCTTFI
mmetsp:Transcript_2013/g.6141  ORF Transcript_2013/g.6141 Transcript_2013/m.6141 type:complete len:201 (-) Transcript_2013:17-619(-)